MAEYAYRFANRLRLTEAPKPAVRQLKRLRAERRKMVDMRTSLKQKRSDAGSHDADMSDLVDMWNQQIALMPEHIAQLARQIAELIDQDPSLRQRFQRRRTAPGMGTAMVEFVCRPFGAGTPQDCLPVWMCSPPEQLRLFVEQP